MNVKQAINCRDVPLRPWNPFFVSSDCIASLKVLQILQHLMVFATTFWLSNLTKVVLKGQSRCRSDLNGSIETLNLGMRRFLILYISSRKHVKDQSGNQTCKERFMATNSFKSPKVVPQANWPEAVSSTSTRYGCVQDSIR